MNAPIRVSIIVLCYNGLEETTRPCLKSIFANTPVNSYELIVVDNASSDGTADFLKAYTPEFQNVHIQLNNSNRGYSGGNNDGIKLARGEYVILLNNDTLVPKGWLDRLLRLFDTQPDVGLIGPVTNSAGNEQRINLKNLNEYNYEKIISSYIERQKNAWFTTERLGFFCVAIRRKVLDTIGVLDENFGIGMFEDDDYCVRAKKAGFVLAIVEDCFVYHKGSVSFSKLSAENYRAIFEENKAYFREKHKFEWSLSNIALSYWQKLNHDLIAYAKNTLKTPSELEKILIRMEPFKHLLVQIHNAELANVPSTLRLASSHPVVTHAKWKSRWNNFKQHMLYGSFSAKWCYLRAIPIKVFHRLIQVQPEVSIPDNVRSKLNAIRKTLNGRPLIIFPATVDFHYMTQRPQHLARAFAEAGYVVIYGTLNRQIDKVEITEQVSENLYLLNEYYFYFLASVFKPEESIYYCLWPNNAKHLKYLPFSYVLYDYMDELSLLNLSANDLERDHLLMLNQADMVTVSADRLMAQIPEHILPKTVLINNAVSQSFIDLFRSYEMTTDYVIENNHPILGYYGAIAEWLDFDLIARLAQALPTARIILIGPVSEAVSKQVTSLLWSHSNVVIFPACKQLELIPLLHRFNVCLIPFLKNTVTDAVSPVKLFEYFSTGKPVVTTNLAECAKYKPVHLAHDHQQFITLVQHILLETSRKIDKTAQAIALNNTWTHRVQQIESIIKTRIVS